MGLISALLLMIIDMFDHTYAAKRQIQQAGILTTC